MDLVRFARVPSSLGPLWVAETSAGVAAASVDASPQPMLDGLRRRFPGWRIEADAVQVAWLAAGVAPTLDLRGLPPFDARVYEAVAEIRAGERVTYGEVAALAGSPRAARAVGRAMARCPLFPAVPCHRVVRAADGWSGWGGDPAMKRRLLDRERADLGYLRSVTGSSSDQRDC